jgi:hypothetical protein
LQLNTDPPSHPPLPTAQYISTSPWTGAARQRLEENLLPSAVEQVITKFVVHFAPIMATTPPPNGRQGDLPRPMVDWIDQELAARGVAIAYEDLGEEPQAGALGEASPPRGA